MDAKDGGADIGRMTNAWLLSPAQARFADAHETHHYCSALPDDGCVYMYRDGQEWTERWLVAADGTQLDWERLSYV